MALYGLKICDMRCDKFHFTMGWPISNAGIVWYSYKEAVGKIYLDSNDLSDRQTKFAIIYRI